jgi:ABC-type lipoprotein export system ATPase subunit
MEPIDKHFNLLIKKYQLNDYYNKFIITSYLATISYECIYMSLVYCSFDLKKNPENLKKYVIIIFSIILLTIGFNRLNTYMQANLLKQIKLANFKHYNDVLIRLSNESVFNINLTQYITTISDINRDIEFYISNLKLLIERPINYVVLVVIAYSTDTPIIILIAFIYYSVINYINNNKINNEKKKLKESSLNDLNIKNYMLNNKNNILNNNINNNYIDNQINMFEDTVYDVSELNNNILFMSSIGVLMFMIIILYTKIEKLDQFTFMFYFMLFYDIEYITKKQNEYYKYKTQYNRITPRIEYLNSYLSYVKKNPIISESNMINMIKITKLENKMPILLLTKPCEIKQNDHILLEGKSGSGKSSFMYMLNNIINVDTIEIHPSIDIIAKQTFITLPHSTDIYCGYLHDIISNYDTNPDIKNIERALNVSKFNKMNTNNNYIDTYQLSAGETKRLSIAKIIYTINTNSNYNILLFDEIDMNMNPSLSYEICKNIKEEFKDKIIIYISHNDSVKSLFSKKIYFNNGIIY